MLNLKKDFPIFSNNPGWIYLDTAATALKPFCLTERLKKFYDMEYSTVNRSVYKKAVAATGYFHETREKLAQLLNALSQEIIFTRGTTESINLLAHSLESFLSFGDAVLISEAEHHSNIVPWQLLRERKGVELKVFKVLDNGEWDLESFKSKLTSNVKIVSVQHVSNVLGTVFPIAEVAKLTKANDSLLIVDGAQAPFHVPINLKELDVDFYVCSMHKLYGPTGLGMLYGKQHLLEKMSPFHGGGDMIEKVTFEKTTYQKSPLKFEAGTPNIADVIAFSSVLDYLLEIGFSEIFEHEANLQSVLYNELKTIEGLKIIGNSNSKIGINSFVIEGIHPLDLAMYLDSKNIALRSGHMCAQPLLNRYNLTHLNRVSLGLYNDEEDVERLITSIKKARSIF